MEGGEGKVSVSQLCNRRAIRACNARVECAVEESQREEKKKRPPWSTFSHIGLV